MLPLVQHYIDSLPDNLFFVLHTYGSHFNYFERYPREFAHLPRTKRQKWRWKTGNNWSTHMITASVIRTIFCTIWSRFWIRRIIRQHFTIARTTGKICWTTTGNASCMLRPIRRIINCTYHYSYGFPISTGRNSRNDMQRHSQPDTTGIYNRGFSHDAGHGLYHDPITEYRLLTDQPWL